MRLAMEGLKRHVQRSEALGCRRDADAEVEGRVRSGIGKRRKQ